MKFTCLSKGRGYHFPPCQILNICGFCILVDCPIDLSSIAIFSPIPPGPCSMLDVEGSNFSNGFESVDPKKQKLERPLDGNSLIRAEPWYKTVKILHLWDISFIDIILISSPMGMLGLPFLTRAKAFSAKIYVTEAALRFGQLMIEDLVSMHKEFKHFYGSGDHCFPQWMKWEELELLPSVLKGIALGKDGTELGGWMPLYSAADVKDCMQKVQSLKYAEEACYNGTLIMKAFSSGLEIGTCNWLISGPKGNIAFLSSSVFDSAVAMNFDCHALQGNDLTLYSDFSFLNSTEDSEDKSSPISDDKDNSKAMVDTGDGSGEMEKLAYICSCVIDSVKAGGSVLIPIGRFNIILQLLELISFSLESSNLKVPMFIISTVAEELLALTNIIPEWLCDQRQNKLFSCEPLFAHAELVKEKKLHLFPTVYSQELLAMWQEPCIVFSPHWSLRLGPAVPLLQRWCGDPKSLLVMEEGENVDLALLPFKPMAMNVCQCSFLSGMKLRKIEHLLNILQPKSVLLPDELNQQPIALNMHSLPVFHYSEGQTLRVPSLKGSYKMQVSKELLRGRSNSNKIKMANLRGGELWMERGKYQLRDSKMEQADSSPQHRGS